MNVLLLVAAAGLLKRRYAVRKLFLAYALIGLITAGFSVYAQLHGQGKQQAAMEAWVEEHGEKNEMTIALSRQFEQQKQAAGVSTLVGIGISLGLGGAWPLFCAFWFGAIKGREESWTGVPAENDQAG